MTWDQVKEIWRKVLKQVHLTWGKLSDEDLAFIDGDRQRLIDRFARSYGRNETEAVGCVDDFVYRLDPPSPPKAMAMRIRWFGRTPDPKRSH